MLDNLRADFELCRVAMTKHLHQQRWYRYVPTLDSFLQKTVSFSITALLIWLYYTYLFTRLGWRWTAIIILSLFVLVLCWAIRAVRYFHEGAVRNLLSQHQAATGLFHKNAEVIAHLNYAEGRAAEMVHRAGGRADMLDDETVHDWSKEIVKYLEEYKLYEFASRLSADDMTLLKALPEGVPSNADVLRRERFNARRQLLTEFTRELRKQAINSPFGSTSDSSLTPPDRT